MNSFAQKSRYGRRCGFTLIEMLVAVSILALIMVMAAQMIGATSKLWKNTTSKIEAFQSARDGFQLMTDELRQATLNTYWDYFDSTGLSARFTAQNPFIPAAYGRQSDLDFRCGQGAGGLEVTQTDGIYFQAPLGYVAAPATYGNLQNLLNSVGFWIQASDGTNVLNASPPFMGVTPAYRYRLMQLIQPSESNQIFKYSLTSGTTAKAWLLNAFGTSALQATNVRIVANNIIGLVIWPKSSDSPTDSLSTDYSYESRLGLKSGAAVPNTVWKPGIGSQPLQMNQMPPLIRIAMVAIDEASAKLIVPNASNESDAIATAITQINSSTGQPLFTVSQYMDSDLLYFQYGPQGLATISPRLNFRVFSTTVVVKSARFSTQ